MICQRCQRDRVLKARNLCHPCYRAYRHLYPPLPRPGKPLAAGDVACQHCRERRVNRPRGLCTRCYYTSGIRDLYPVGSANPETAKYTRFCDRDPSVTPDFMGPAALPDVPTTAAPGTEAKMLVMESRVAARRAVHHPADARYAGDRRPLEWMQRRVNRER